MENNPLGTNQFKRVMTSVVRHAMESGSWRDYLNKIRNYLLGRPISPHYFTSEAILLDLDEDILSSIKDYFLLSPPDIIYKHYFHRALKEHNELAIDRLDSNFANS